MSVITAGISTTQRTSQRGVDEKGNPSEKTQSAPRVSSVGAEDGVGRGGGGPGLGKHSLNVGSLNWVSSLPLCLFTVNFDHFQILRAIGKGSFGKVR